MSDISPNFRMFDPERLAALTRNYQLADYQHEIIMEEIKEFESQLDDDHEVALKLASFGQSITIQVVEIGYSNPSLIHFHGYVNGNKATLIQHIGQLNFLMTSVPKTNPQKPPIRVTGFSQEAE